VPPAAERELRALRALVGELRIERQLSQYDAGLAGGLKHKYVGQLERGRLAPSFRALVGVARGLGMTPAEFFRRLADALDAAERSGSSASRRPSPAG
jgi:transcriptional regulator with XRE-family HTH domain